MLPTCEPAVLVSIYAPTDPLFTDRDLERVYGLTRSTQQKKRLTGGGPPFIKIGAQVRYRKSDVEAWLAAFPARRSTSDHGGSA